VKAREAAEKKWLAAREKLAEAKKNGATKKEKQKSQQEIDHWKRKMDFSGENHSQTSKR
jgi:hypothetical protein